MTGPSSSWSSATSRNDLARCIRYATGDLVRRDLTRVDRPIMEFAGRSFDCIQLPNGERISPYRIDVALEHLPDLRAFEVVAAAGPVHRRHDRRAAGDRWRARRAIANGCTALLGQATDSSASRREPSAATTAIKFRPIRSLARLAAMNILSLTYEYLPIGGGGSRVCGGDQRRAGPARRRSHRPDLGHAGFADDGRSRRRRASTARHCVRRHSPLHDGRRASDDTPAGVSARRELIRQSRPDVIHTHFILPSGVVAWALSKRFRIPYVLTAHGSDVPGYNPDRFSAPPQPAAAILERILNDAAAVTSPSRFLARLMHHEGCRVPVSVVRTAIGRSSVSARNAEPDSSWSSRMFPRKGIQHFIDAVAGMDNGWEMIVAGDGPYRAELEARARRVAPKVRFVGFVGPEALRACCTSPRASWSFLRSRKNSRWCCWRRWTPAARS